MNNTSKLINEYKKHQPESLIDQTKAFFDIYKENDDLEISTNYEVYSALRLREDTHFFRKDFDMERNLPWYKNFKKKVKIILFATLLIVPTGAMAALTVL